MPSMMRFKIVLAGPHSSCETSQSETSQELRDLTVRDLTGTAGIYDSAHLIFHGPSVRRKISVSCSVIFDVRALAELYVPKGRELS